MACLNENEGKKQKKKGLLQKRKILQQPPFSV